MKKITVMMYNSCIAPNETNPTQMIVTSTLSESVEFDSQDIVHKIKI